MKKMHLKVWALILIGVGAIVLMFLHAPIPQGQAYHHFADQRMVWDIPHFGDVVTNLPFLVIGIFGLAFLLRHRRTGPIGPFFDKRERFAYTAFFMGLTLVFFGSTWYHLSPNNESQFWDRLPITIVFMSLFTIVITERISLWVGPRLLLPLLAVGIVSVWYWRYTERMGHGDLRLYALVQFCPMLMIPLILWLFSPRYTHDGYFWWALGWYGFAKLCELLDNPIYATNGIVSGHNLKHLATALATGCILRMLQQRYST